MKTWQSILFGILLGLLFSGALLLVVAPPRGKPIELSPLPTLAPLVVYITGAVAHPGVYSLPRLSRVSNAIDAAGGLAPDADQTTINLAARLLDGEKVAVPKISQPVVGSTQAPTFQNKPPAVTAGLSTPSVENPLNINTASADELDLLPGIGPTRATDIVAYRTQHGPFKTIEGIMQVSGIGQTTFDRIKDLIYVDTAE